MNSIEHAAEYPRAAEAIVSRHYFHYYLQSFDREKEACYVTEEVKLCHKRGGFTIRSSVELGRSQFSDGLRKPRPPLRRLSAKRVLGMQRKATVDVLVFSSEMYVETAVPTK